MPSLPVMVEPMPRAEVDDGVSVRLGSEVIVEDDKDVDITLACSVRVGSGTVGKLCKSFEPPQIRKIATSNTPAANPRMRQGIGFAEGKGFLFTAGILIER